MPKSRTVSLGPDLGTSAVPGSAEVQLWGRITNGPASERGRNATVFITHAEIRALIPTLVRHLANDGATRIINRDLGVPEELASFAELPAERIRDYLIDSVIQTLEELKKERPRTQLRQRPVQETDYPTRAEIKEWQA